MSKYKINDKYKVTGDEDSSEPKLTKKYRRKSSTKADTLRSSRSLSLGSLRSAQLSAVEINEPITSPVTSPTSEKKVSVEFIPLPYSSKGNPFTNDNMYGYKDQYDSVGKHTEKGIEFLEKYASFLKKRCDIETSYANDLKRLVKSFQPRKKEEDENQFTWNRGFWDMLKELHDLAGQHEVIAENTQHALMPDIHKCVAEMKNERKKYLQDGTKLQSQMKDSLKSLENAKKNYEKKFSEAERALDSYKRADADINLSRAEVEKTRSLSNKRAQEADESKSEYAAQLQKTNNFQRDYFTSQMPQVFQNLQNLDEQRITKVKTVIHQSAKVEQNVLPIINTCIEGMLKAADSINHQKDSQVVVEKYRTGFPVPGDIAFEDLANGPHLNNGKSNVIHKNSNSESRLKTGTIGGKQKKRGGVFNMFKSSNMEEQKDDFSNVPPAQRKAKLLKQIDEIRKKIAHETAEREGMIKMKEVYEQNPALGDPNSLHKKIEQNSDKLNSLQSEMKKYQDYLSDAENDMKRRGSNDSMTMSTTSESSTNAQISAPGTPIQQHNQDEYYEPVEEPPMYPEPEAGTPEPIDDDFSYPVIGTCRALYAFEAVNDGSVNMSENEELWVLEQDQGDGWTRIRKNDSSEGFVPTSYIQCHFYDQDAV